MRDCYGVTWYRNASTKTRTIPSTILNHLKYKPIKGIEKNSGPPKFKACFIDIRRSFNSKSSTITTHYPQRWYMQGRPHLLIIALTITPLRRCCSMPSCANIIWLEWLPNGLNHQGGRVVVSQKPFCCLSMLLRSLYLVNILHISLKLIPFAFSVSANLVPCKTVSLCNGSGRILKWNKI